MKIYLVGGAVRDQLLGRTTASDKDYLVTGATTDDMLNAGCIQVGKAFPVFIDPQTKNEYALARMEKKTTPGYTGFQPITNPNITVEQDLKRRDLTINAIAFDGQHYIDPYGGISDLKHKIFRPIGNNFEDDPVRVLRLARFKACFPDFSFHKSLYPQIRALHQKGELNALEIQRLRQEMEKSFTCLRPSLFFKTLIEFDIFQTIFPEITSLKSFHLLDKCALTSSKKHIYYAILLATSMNHPKQRENFLKRFGLCQHKIFILQFALLHDQNFQFALPQDFLRFIQILRLHHSNHHIIDDIYSAMGAFCDAQQTNQFCILLKNGAKKLASMNIQKMIKVHRPQNKGAFVDDLYIQSLGEILTQFQSR